MEYVPYLRNRLLDIFSSSDIEANEAVSQIIQILDYYGLSRDDFMETFKELQFIKEKDERFADRYEKIDSKLKAQLTRTYNSMEHTSQALVAAQVVGKKKGSGRTKVAIADEDEDWEVDDGDDGPAEAEDEAEEEEVDMSKFLKKGRGSSSSAKTSSSTSSKPTSSSSKATSSSSSSSSSKVKKK